MYQWWLTRLQKSYLSDINKHNSSRVACHRQVTWSWKITTKLDHGKFALHVTKISAKEAKGIENDSLIRNCKKEKKKRRQNYEEKKTKWNACVGFQRAYEVIYRWKKGSDDIKQIISLKDHCELSINWSWITQSVKCVSLHVLCYYKIWPNKGRRLRKSGFIHCKYWDSHWFYLSVARGLTLFASPGMSYVRIRVDLSLNFRQFPVAT